MWIGSRWVARIGKRVVGMRGIWIWVILLVLLVLVKSGWGIGDIIVWVGREGSSMLVVDELGGHCLGGGYRICHQG